MEREKFVKLVEEALDTLPIRFHKRMQNVSVLVENIPPEQRSQRGSRNSGIADVGDLDNLVLGFSELRVLPRKSVFDAVRAGRRLKHAFSREYPQLRKACLRCLPALTASCSIRRTSRPCAPMKTKSGGKFV